MTEPVALGIDIGGTNTVYGFVSENGHVHHHEEIPTYGSKPVLDRCAQWQPFYRAYPGSAQPQLGECGYCGTLQRTIRL